MVGMISLGIPLLIYIKIIMKVSWRKSIFIFTKEINVYIRPNDLSKATDILQKHKLDINFFDIQGPGRTPRSTYEIIHSCQTDRTTHYLSL